MNKVLKRFYKEAAAGSSDGGFTVLLDGRAVRTPKGAKLCVASQRLAQEIAKEWEQQGETIDPETMPLMQLAATALDRVGAERQAMQENLLRYAQTDLLCYRAGHPADLVRRQAELWQPILDWAALQLDAPLKTTEGLAPVEQPKEAVDALASHLAGLDDWRFTALSVAVAATGSLLLGLALILRQADAETVIAASQLDEDHQRQLWGEDEEATERLALLAGEIRSAGRLLDLIG
jgi:chaperone required for assembly of F1-ATPase